MQRGQGRQGFLQEKYYLLLAKFAKPWQAKNRGRFFAKTDRQTEQSEVQTLPTKEGIILPIAGQ